MADKTCENCVFCDVHKLGSDPCYSCNDDDKWEPKKSKLRYEVAALRAQLAERGDDGVIREPEEFALASELQAVRGELATARDALRGIWPFIEEDDGGFATPAYQKAINDVRAALAMTTAGMRTEAISNMERDGK